MTKEVVFIMLAEIRNYIDVLVVPYSATFETNKVANWL